MPRHFGGAVSWFTKRSVGGLWYVLVNDVRVGDGEGFVSAAVAHACVLDEIYRLYEARVISWPEWSGADERVKGGGLAGLDGLRVEFKRAVVSVTHRRNSDPGGYVVPGRRPGE